jgi:hypothetical protein
MDTKNRNKEKLGVHTLQSFEKMNSSEEPTNEAIAETACFD